VIEFPAQWGLEQYVFKKNAEKHIDTFLKRKKLKKELQ